MVTVIRPSRARGALKGRIPRLQCAVFTFKEGRMLVAVVSGSKAERLGFPLCPRKRTYLPILELLPSPTLGERRHRGHARRLVPYFIVPCVIVLVRWLPISCAGRPTFL